MPTNKLPRAFVFGVDLDGVVAGYMDAMKPLVAEFTGQKLEDLTTPAEWDFTGWGISEPDQLTELFRWATAEKHIFRHMPPRGNAPEVLRKLASAGIHIRIVTHRLAMPGMHEIVVVDTVKWLEEHRIPYWDLCFLGAKSDLTVDLLIDDAPHNIQSQQDAGQPILIMDHGYNQHLDGPRAKTWDDVYDHVTGLVAADAQTFSPLVPSD